MNRRTPGLPVHHQLPEFTQTHVYWVGDAIQPSLPLSSPSPPAPNPSQHQGLFQWVSSSMRWPKYWSFSFSISPSNEHPGLISFRMDWLDLLAVQGSLKSLLQHHSSKASIFRCSAFFTVQLSHKAHLLVMSLPNSEAMIYQEVGCFGCPVQAFRQEQEVKTDSGVRGKLRRGGVWDHLLQEQSSPTPP